MAIAALVVGFLSLVLSVVCVGAVLGPVAVILGIASLVQLKSQARAQVDRRGLRVVAAALGIGFGIVGFVVSLHMIYVVTHYCQPGYPCEG